MKGIPLIPKALPKSISVLALIAIPKQAENTGQKPKTLFNCGPNANFLLNGFLESFAKGGMNNVFTAVSSSADMLGFQPPLHLIFGNDFHILENII